ncbi:gamma-glutamyltransferase [Candidatus Micrarchaeota archaeon]|nr:gamma-glutamyltransferase [Candidatus Micrarchaeota archaeon]
MKEVVACGHTLTAKAAVEALNNGGNAFDAALAACFASTTTEPMLTSLAGAGVGLLHSGHETTCVDFLANFPKKGHTSDVKPIKKIVSFGDETQVFYLGYGSIGVPGNLEGFLHIHKNYCSLELDQLLLPAIKYAKGHRLNKLQAFVNVILEPFCLYTKESREIFAPNEKLLKEGDIIRNLKFANFLELLASDEKAAMKLYLRTLTKQLKTKKTTLSVDDITSYKVKEREPLEITYRRHQLSLTPPPSAGGLLIASGLKHIEPVALKNHNSIEHVDFLAQTMQYCDSERTAAFFKRLLYEKGFWKKFLKKPERLGGTTHISIIDKEGNAAGITSSNGQGTGVMIGDTGIMHNNFAAEPDLMQYKKLYRPGERITTMMCPTIIHKNGKLKAILGSGGSNRIRSAIMQVISNLIDFSMSPQKASNASRVHYEAGVLQLEYGIKKRVMDSLSKKYKVNKWTEKNLFFGGVHIATSNGGGGDKRRGGTVIVMP